MRVTRRDLLKAAAATPLLGKAQHCRADVHLDGNGWSAMDSADVRKVMLEEVPGGLLIDDPVQSASKALFGGWEGMSGLNVFACADNACKRDRSGMRNQVGWYECRARRPSVEPQICRRFNK